MSSSPELVPRFPAHGDEDARAGKTFHTTRRVRLKSRRHALLLSYDGAGFSGFQRQPGRRTVEGTLLEALAAQNLPGGLAFAGRTDAGVHALGQTVVVRIPVDRDAGEALAALDRRLPPDIRIRSHVLAPKTFHPRWSAVSKRYRYWLALPNEVADEVGTGTPEDETDVRDLRTELRRLVDDRGLSGLTPWNVGDRASFDPDRFRRALHDLRHAPDLRGFTAHGAPFRNMPPLIGLRCEVGDGWVTLSFEGPGFARYAVRHMVGCAVAVARGEVTPEACGVVAVADHPYRGLRAPPEALVLESVVYPKEVDPFGVDLMAAAAPAPAS